MLAPADMVLHSAAHLFQDGDFQGGLRDLLDLDGLLRHFAAGDAGFWENLSARASQLGLDRPLFYALRFTSRLLGTPVPGGSCGAATGRPPAPVLALMDRLVTLALVPEDPERRRRGAGLARWLLYVRSHWLRVPPLLLARHLLRKGLRRGPVRA